MFCKLNVKHIRFRCSFSIGHISGSLSIANSWIMKKTFENFDIANDCSTLIIHCWGYTCFVKSVVKSGNPVKVELDAAPDIEFLFPFPLLLVKLCENRLFLCWSWAPGALLVLLCELFDPILDVLADSQLSLLPFCNDCNENFNRFNWIHSKIAHNWKLRRFWGKLFYQLHYLDLVYLSSHLVVVHLKWCRSERY